MKNKNLITLALITFFIFLLTSYIIISKAYAENDKRIADSFTQHGISEINNGNYKGAIDDLSRALLLNPHDEIAQRYLFKIGMKEGISSQQKFNIIILEDTVNLLKSTKEKINYYFRKNNNLINKLIKNGHKEDSINKELENIENYVKAKENFDEFNMDDINIKNEDILEVVNNLFNFEKRYLLAKLEYSKMQYSRLNELSTIKVFNEFKKTKNQRNIYAKSEKFYSRDGVFIAQKQTYPMTQEKYDELVILKKEFSELRNQLDELKSIVDIRDKKVEEITNELVELSLKLTEKDKMLDDKDNTINQINNQFDEFQSRIKLGQKIIEEKDAEIKSLKDNIYSLRLEMKSREEEINKLLLTKDEKLLETNGFLQIYKSKLKDFDDLIKKKDAYVTTLEDQLEYVQKQLFDANKELKNTKLEMLSLNKRVEFLENELNRYKNDVENNYLKESKNNQIKNLQSNINNVREYLSEKKRDIVKFDVFLFNN